MKMPNTFKQLQPVRVNKKEESNTHYKVLFPNAIQIDLQFYNSDNGYRYLLVAVNTVSQGLDFQEIKNKTPTSIINAMQKILDRKLVGEDIKYISCDNGTEFLNKTFLDWCTSKGIIVRSGRAGRHNQTAYVDAFSLVISKVLGIKSTIEQEEKNKINNKVNQKKWVCHLSKLRVLLNEKLVKVAVVSDFFKKSSAKPKFRLGEMVFVRLEKPVDVNDNKLSGRFRLGDFYYEKKPRKIVDIKHTYDNNPPRFCVEGIKTATFASWELIPAK